MVAMIERLTPELEALGFRLSLGATEVDTYLTEEEIETLESIAAAYSTRRTIADMIENERE
jgi:cob(I)alamin adenosyltransferase